MAECGVVGVSFVPRSGTTRVMSVLSGCVGGGLRVEGGYPWEGVLFSSCVELGLGLECVRDAREVGSVHWVRHGVWVGLVGYGVDGGLDGAGVCLEMWGRVRRELLGRFSGLWGEKVVLRHAYAVRRWGLRGVRWCLVLRPLEELVASKVAWDTRHGWLEWGEVDDGYLAGLYAGYAHQYAGWRRVIDSGDLVLTSRQVGCPGYQNDGASGEAGGCQIDGADLCELLGGWLGLGFVDRGGIPGGHRAGVELAGWVRGAARRLGSDEVLRYGDVVREAVESGDVGVWLSDSFEGDFSARTGLPSVQRFDPCMRGIKCPCCQRPVEP